MSSPKQATATFASATTHHLTVTKTGTGTGSVTSDPAGIDCGATCDAAFDAGAQVTLTATPSAGSTFTGWSGECTGSGSCVVTMDADKDAQATFVEKPSLTVTVKGKGKVTSSPAGIACPKDCSEAYSPGAKVSLSKKPAAGWHFLKWKGACSGKHACAVTLDADRTVRAVFAKNA
jgi:hypothetical protein